jgi:hypothetical protein
MHLRDWPVGPPAAPNSAAARVATREGLLRTAVDTSLEPMVSLSTLVRVIRTRNHSLRVVLDAPPSRKGRTAVTRGTTPAINPFAKV